MSEPSKISCGAGEQWDDTNDKCVPCNIGTYNHGGAPYRKEDCYSINDREIIYKDRFSVQCALHWDGIPVYEDGEYEGGCKDGDLDIFDYKQIGTNNKKCDGIPYINWKWDENGGKPQLSADNCAEWCTEDDSCCKIGEECRPCCLSFTLNKSLCYGFHEPIEYAIKKNNFKCFTWNFEKSPTFFPTNIYNQLPHICNILNMTSRFLGPKSTPYPSRRPSPWPSRKPTPYPSNFPSPYPSPWPTKIPTNLPSFHRKKVYCPAGYHYYSKKNECIPCEYRRYNHGQMHFREDCYEVPLSAIFSYLNSTDIQCNFGGTPIYHNGEYEFGCNTYNPTAIPSYIPTGIPSYIPTAIPSYIPTQPITLWPSALPSAPQFVITCPPPTICPKPNNCPNIGLWGAILVGSALGIYGFYNLIIQIAKFLRRRRRTTTQEIEGIEIRQMSEDPNANLPLNDSMRITIPVSPQVRRTRQTSASI